MLKYAVLFLALLASVGVNAQAQRGSGLPGGGPTSLGANGTCIQSNGTTNVYGSCGGGGGSGTVTSFSFTNGNGATGVVIGTTTTPALTLSPTATGTFAASANNLGFFAATTSLQLAGVISDETGTGALVFAGSPTFTGTVTAATVTEGTTTITSTSSNALAVGANGATNPVLSVDASTASVVSGVAIKGSATGVAPTITTIDSGATSGLTVQQKGASTLTLGNGGNSGSINVTQSDISMQVSNTGNFNINQNGTTVAQFRGNGASITPKTSSTASLVRIQLTPSADTALTASTNAIISQFGPVVIRQHSTGALTLQNDYLFNGMTDSFVGASTQTDGATAQITLKSCGTNATCTNESGLYIPTAAITGTIANSYGINVAAATGATNNYAARLIGGTLTDGLISAGTKFTTSGCSVSATSGGGSAGTYTSGTTGACSVVITMNGATGLTAPTGWACSASDRTTASDLITQTASSTTTATMAGTTVSGDVISFYCMGY